MRVIPILIALQYSKRSILKQKESQEEARRRSVTIEALPRIKQVSLSSDGSSVASYNSESDDSSVTIDINMLSNDIINDNDNDDDNDNNRQGEHLLWDVFSKFFYSFKEVELLNKKLLMDTRELSEKRCVYV
eukprot:GHVR01049735.1.p1 GENE.GHVR01049735.1~~GHVR01049735.1.p1  ORF type:complete len:132 (+),score=24.60 GHVR01049735.1:201-596(+)